ncbi:hypothetical protein ACUODJ_61510, partial [Escherichia sp. HC-CC]
SAPASVTGDEGDLPQGVNLNINLSPQQPLPDKAPEMGGGPTGDSDDEINALRQIPLISCNRCGSRLHQFVH